MLIRTIALTLLISTSVVSGEESLGQLPLRQADKSSLVIRERSVLRDSNGNTIRDPRPARWCGWWLRKELGVADRAYNQARRWASYGSPAPGPAPGTIAVWRHHVGIVTGVPGPGRIILKSGNDGNAVRERERSSRGVIAWRWPGATFASQ